MPRPSARFGIRAGGDERAQCLDVALAAVAEHDRLDHRRPAQVVHVVERRAGGDQHPDDLVVTEVRGGDQRGAVVGAGHVLRAGAAFERDLEHRHVVGDGGDGHDVVALRVERVRVCAALHEHPGGVVLPAVRGDVQRRAPVAVAQLAVRAGGDEALDLGDVAGGGRGVQAGVRADFRLGGRDLCERLHARRGEKRDAELQTAGAGPAHPSRATGTAARRRGCPRAD